MLRFNRHFIVLYFLQIDAEFLAWVMQEEDNGSNASGAGQNESHAVSDLALPYFVFNV